MPERPRARLTPYGVAVLATAVCLLICWPLRQVLGADGAGNLRWNVSERGCRRPSAWEADGLRGRHREESVGVA
jgi:hypothetical protein